MWRNDLSSMTMISCYKVRQLIKTCTILRRCLLITLLDIAKAQNSRSCVKNNIAVLTMSTSSANRAISEMYGTQHPEDYSVHAAHITEVHYVPLNILIRPIPSVLDEHKVQSLMETIRVILFIDQRTKVLWLFNINSVTCELNTIWVFYYYYLLINFKNS